MCCNQVNRGFASSKSPSANSAIDYVIIDYVMPLALMRGLSHSLLEVYCVLTIKNYFWLRRDSMHFLVVVVAVVAGRARPQCELRVGIRCYTILAIA